MACRSGFMHARRRWRGHNRVSSAWSLRSRRGRSTSPAGWSGGAQGTLPAAGGSLRGRVRWRGVTFFQPQTHLPQHLPQTADAHMHRNSRLQLLLQLCQGQVGLNLDPAAQSLLYSGVTCAAIHAVARSAPSVRYACVARKSPRPRQAHREARRQLIQRALPRSWASSNLRRRSSPYDSPSSVCRRVRQEHYTPNAKCSSVTQELLALLSEIDEFKGAWRLLGTIAPND